MTPQLEAEFDERFPSPDHERMSKCLCRSEEEHEMHYEWRADPNEVKAWIDKHFVPRPENYQ